MGTKNTTLLSFNLPQIDQEEVVIMRDCSSFPHVRREFISSSVVISIVTSGSSSGFYEQQPVTVSKNDVSIIMPYHSCCDEFTSEDYQVTLIIISQKLVDEIETILNYRTRAGYHYKPTAHLTDKQLSSILSAVDTLHSISELSDMQKRHELILHMIQVIGEMLDYYRGEQDVRLFASNRQDEIFNHFYSLLITKYHLHHSVNYYADQLGLSPKYLSRSIYKATGHTAGYWIDGVIAVHAKQLLLNYPSLPIKQICYKMGFDELSNFTRFFKRCTGYSPAQFRREMTK